MPLRFGWPTLPRAMGRRSARGENPVQPRRSSYLHNAQQLASCMQVLGQVNDLLAESGEAVLSSISTPLPCFTQGESIRCSTRAGRGSLAGIGRLFRIQAGRKQALRTGAEDTKQELAMRSPWRLRGTLSPKVPYRLFTFFEKVVSRRAPKRALTFRGSVAQPSAVLTLGVF